MISDFSQRIEVRRIGLSTDFGFGEPAQTETSILSTYAAIVQISRKDAIRQGLEAETIQYRMRIRYASGRNIQMSDVVIWKGVRYNPRTSPTVIEIDKMKFLEVIIVTQNG